MNLFKRFFQKEQPRFHDVEIKDFKIAGAGFKNENGSSRQKFIRNLQIGQAIQFKREKSPQFPEAIALWSDKGQIGYVPEYLAHSLSSIMDDGGKVSGKVHELLEKSKEYSFLSCVIITEIYRKV